jgi:hypothetical protein
MPPLFSLHRLPHTSPESTSRLTEEEQEVFRNGQTHMTRFLRLAGILYFWSFLIYILRFRSKRNFVIFIMQEYLHHRCSMKKLLATLFLILFLNLFGAASQPSLTGSYDAYPSAFIPNVGQVTDQAGNERKDILFIYQSNEFNLLLSASGFSMQLFHFREALRHGYEDGQPGRTAGGFSEEKEAVVIERVDVVLAGANRDAWVAADLKEEEVIQYYSGGKKLRTTPYRRITYHNIYPHIDLVFHAGTPAGERHPRFEFHLHPGANPADIRLEHSGASQLKLITEEETELATSMGWVRYSGLHTFYEQSGEEIPVSFVVKNTELSFSLAGAVSQAVVIDPNILWGTYFGGEKNESNSFDLIHDGHENLVITGATKSALNIASTGAYQTTYAGGSGDMYLAKFSTQGSRIWSTYFGGTSNEISYAAAADLNGDLYMVGNSSSDGLTTDSAHQKNQAGAGDNIIAKFDSGGSLIWCTLMGGTHVEQIRSAMVDSAGNVFVAGYTESEFGIAGNAAFDETYNGDGDAFISKFSSSGRLIWSNYIGGPGQDRAHSIIADGAVIYVLGTTESDTGMASPGALQEVRGGHEDAWLAKFDTAGIRIWSTYFGGAEEDHGRCVRTDLEQNIYICGFTASSNGIATPGAHQYEWYESYSPAQTPLVDGFLAKFDPAGQQIWGTYYGGEGNDQMVSIDLNEEGSIYCVGSTGSKDSIASKNPMMTFHGFSGEGMVIKFDSSGQRTWGTFFGGWGTDDLWAVAADTNDFIYFIGKTDSFVQTTLGAFQTASSGGVEAIIYKLYGGKSCFDAYEPNESSYQAAILPFSSDTNTYGITACMKTSDDQDWYSFTMLDGFPYFKIKLTDLEHDYNLKLYRTNGQLLMQARNPGERDETLSGRLFANTYHLQVTHAPTAFDSTNCYRLIIVSGPAPFDDTGSREGWSEEKSLLTISPNPAAGEFMVSFYSVSETDAVCELVNPAGVKVASEIFRAEAGLNTRTFPVSSPMPGIYFLILQTPEGDFREKVIIQKN